jgi:hypothetical protein
MLSRLIIMRTIDKMISNYLTSMDIDKFHFLFVAYNSAMKDEDI